MIEPLESKNGQVFVKLEPVTSGSSPSLTMRVSVRRCHSACGQPHRSRRIISRVRKKSSGPPNLIKPSSSKYKVLPGSMAMISKKKFAKIGPIEEKCERFEVCRKYF